MLNLGYEGEVIRVYDADTIAGNATDTTSVVDMAGYEAVVFLVIAGDIGVAGLTAVAEQDENDDVAFPDEEELEGTEIAFANADDDLVGIIDVGKPANRYIRVSMTAGANDCDIDAVLAIKYRARDLPVTQGVTVVDTVVVVTPPAV
jgi:hypothetical protein